MPYPTHQEIEVLYANRDVAIAQLAQKPSIDVADVSGVDRLGLCRIANELWQKCTAALQNKLLVHDHHFVRSCAYMADIEFLASKANSAA